MKFKNEIWDGSEGRNDPQTPSLGIIVKTEVGRMKIVIA